MKSVLTLPASLLLALSACAGSETTPAAPETATTGEDKALTNTDSHLTVVPFVMTTTRTKQDETTSVRFVRGDADGNITSEKDGKTTNVAKVTSDGVFALRNGRGAPAVKLASDGVIHIDGSPNANGVSVGANGEVYFGAKEMLRIEDGKIVDVTGEILKSSIIVNGKVASAATFEIAVEGGDEARRLVGAMLALQLMGGAATTEESSSTVEEADVPEPTSAPTTP